MELVEMGAFATIVSLQWLSSNSNGQGVAGDWLCCPKCPTECPTSSHKSSPHFIPHQGMFIQRLLLL